MTVSSVVVAVHRLPIRPRPRHGEALDSYLERLAHANLVDRPALVAHLTRLRAPSRHLAAVPDPELLGACRALTGLTSEQVSEMTVSSLAGIEAFSSVDDGWRHAGHAWAPGRGTQICPACFDADGTWQITWRHPWVTVCLTHRSWLHSSCPTCKRPFRTQRSSPLRSVDAVAGTCGNPRGARGRSCPQVLGDLVAVAAPVDVVESQLRIDAAIHHRPVNAVDEDLAGKEYLAELKALTVLLLHLACQDGADRIAAWADAACADKARSAGGGGARWGLAPPADPVLRGLALTAADHVLQADSVEDAAERLGPWLGLTPQVPEGQLGWLADRTAITPVLARLVIAATSARRRLSTLLAHGQRVATEQIPQLFPAAFYTRHLASLIDVTDATGRLFASLCLARLGRPDVTWATAATALGLPAELGTRTARACSAEILCGAPAFIDAITEATHTLDPTADYRAREAVVRHLAARTRWYTAWSRAHGPGTRSTSKPYALAWLWTTYAGGLLAASPGWATRPASDERTRYRRYAARLSPNAQRALIRVATTAALRIRRRKEMHMTNQADAHIREATGPIDPDELARIRVELTRLGEGFRHAPPPTTRNQILALHEIGRDLLAYATRLLIALDPTGGEVERVRASTRAYLDREDVWALLDADSLISLHGTEQGARDAREVHLAQFSSWPDDVREQCEQAVDLIALHVEQP